MKKIIITNIFVFITILACGMASAAEKLPVFVSILPQKYFVEKIGGDHVDVSVMVAPGASPATYEPKPGQMADLSKAAIYFAVGVPFENAWLDKIRAANTKMIMVHTESGVEKMPMATHHHEEAAAGHKEHDGIRDPHIWLSPSRVMVQSRNILAALVRADPEQREIYQAAYRKWIGELVDLDMELCNIFASSGEKNGFMVFHPSWGYFAADYGLKQIPVEIEGKEPKPSELQELITDARKEGVGAVFVQPQFSQKSARLIAETVGAQLVTVDPLAPEWLDNLRQTAEKFRLVLK